jgi:capsule polysaccharide export protein KpsE/RkpR
MNPRRHTAPEFERPDIVAPIRGTEYARTDQGDEPGFLAAQALWEHKSFLLTVALRAVVAFLALALLLPATYQSKTQLMPPDPQSATATMLAALAGGSSLGGGAGEGSGGALGMAADMLGLKSSGALFISILKSDAVENDLINRFDLRGVYWVKTYKQARKKLASRTSIDEDKKSGVITIEVTDRNRRRATELAQAYLNELNKMVATLNTSAAHRERVFLEGRLKVVKEELDNSAKDLSEYSSQHTTLDLKEQGRAMLEAAATLQGQLIAAQSELRGLEQIYTPYNVRVKTVRARIDELEHQLDKLGGAPTTAEPDLDSQEIYPSIKQLPIVGLTYADLYRRVKINETVYEVLRKEYELARVQEAKEIPVVKVLVPPEFPEKRSGPPRTLIFFGGILLSLLLASTWILGQDAWAKTNDENPKKRFARGVAEDIAGNLRWNRAKELPKRILPEAFWQRNRHRDPDDKTPF